MASNKTEFMSTKPYRPILGCIIWGSSGTRPDLSFACSVLGHVQSNPAPEHWKLLIGVCRIEAGKGVKPLGYVDVDWAGCVDTRRSTSGYIFFMGGAPVSWSSKRQVVVALSSTESEYISTSWGAQQAMWMNNWLDEAGLREDFPFPLIGDNLGSISLTETNKVHGLSKHIHVRFHYIRDRVRDGEITVTAISTKENIADILTKALPRATHEKFVRQMGLNWRRHDARGSVKE